MQIAETVFLI